MRALFITDNRPGSGFGHVVRCRALANELENRGFQTETIGPGDEALFRHDVTIIDLLPDVRPYLPPHNCVLIVDGLTPVSPCELLVNGSAGVDIDRYEGVSAARVLAGPQFSLLRPEFVKMRDKAKDRHGVLDIRFIVGWSAEDLAAEILGAVVAVSYAGMRAMECACLGTPTVLMARNEGEQLNAHGLMQAGACVVASEDEAPVMAQTMLDCPGLLSKMGANARALVDGKGVRRVAQAIEEMLG